MKVNDVINNIEQRFRDAKLCYYHGTSNSFEEACFLIGHILNIVSFDEQALQQNVNDSDVKNIISLCDKRILTRQPMAYLLNYCNFAGHEFYVDNRVMIPTSPFAEIINNNFRPWVYQQPKYILDLCTGSGALAIASAYIFPNAIIDAVDVSQDALQVARINVEKHKLVSKVNLVESNLFEKIDKKYNIIISNPPYVPVDDYNDLEPEFLAEPKLAFTANNNGLALVNDILLNAASFLHDDGVILVEIGNYIDNVEEYYESIPFTWVELYNGGEGIFVFSKQELQQYFG